MMPKKKTAKKKTQKPKPKPEPKPAPVAKKSSIQDQLDDHEKRLAKLENK